MNEDTVSYWANHLTEAEAQLILLKAAKDHPRKFTNHEQIGMEWARVLRRQSYESLGSYARNCIAHRYLSYCDERAGRRIPIGG